MLTDWIDLNLRFGGPNDKIIDHSQPSLGKIGMLKPGVLVEMDDGEQYLIGDINEQGGCCDCCSMVDSDDIVKRYKVVFEKPVQ